VIFSGGACSFPTSWEIRAAYRQWLFLEDSTLTTITTLPHTQSVSAAGPNPSNPDRPRLIPHPSGSSASAGTQPEIDLQPQIATVMQQIKAYGLNNSAAETAGKGAGQALQGFAEGVRAGVYGQPPRPTGSGEKRAVELQRSEERPTLKSSQESILDTMNPLSQEVGKLFISTLSKGS
jgi:hypothetical protein